MSIENKSFQSIGSHKDRQYDTFGFRLEFVKGILDGQELRPIVDVDETSTEQFIHPNGFDGGGNQEDEKNIQVVLGKKRLNFYKVIDQIGGELTYVKSGTTGHTFRGSIPGENGQNIYYAVKVVAYPKKEKYGNINDIRRPENAELMMIRLLSYFVIRGQTPHIILPIATFNTSILPFTDLIENEFVHADNNKYLEFVERYKNGEYYDNVSILLSEWANKGDFLDFVKRYYKQITAQQWKVFFFQIISVLAVIQSKFPSFRHNDLKANNILVHKISKRDTLYRYKVNKCTYIVPAVEYFLKIWDFDFACIPGIVDNAKVYAKWTNQINVTPKQNRYYDMHFFFNTFIKKGFFSQFLEDPCIPREAIEFVNRVVPKEYQEGQYVSPKGRLMLDLEYVTPDTVLKTDPYFEEFRMKENQNCQFKKQPSINRSKITSSSQNIIQQSNVQQNTSVTSTPVSNTSSTKKKPVKYILSSDDNVKR